MLTNRRKFLTGIGVGIASNFLPESAWASGKTMTWHGRNLADHIKMRDDAIKQGYRFLSLSIYGSVSAPLYAAVMILRPNIVVQHDFPALTIDEYQKRFEEEAQKGYGPVIIAATGPGHNPRFAVVFEPQNPVLLARHSLKSGDTSDQSTIQGMNAYAKSNEMIPRWIASYGTADKPYYAALWMPNTHKAVWNVDGVLDTAADYQKRVDAQTSAWDRPAFITLNQDNRYLSVFHDNQIGEWVARHNMSSHAYEKELNSWTGKGYFPSCVQAAGTDGTSARFAALFIKQEIIVPKSFTPTGPVANSAIDDVVKNIMQTQPLRQASLAIVKGTKLVYARGYTYAEPGWPLTQPETCFRIASVSKTITAMAIFQLLEQQKLKLSDKVQDILQMKTPSGKAPFDVQFNDVSVEQLLEHVSGINTWRFNRDIDIQAAFQKAQPTKTWNLPISTDMVDSYIASLPLDHAPGTVQTYNNCGHYLLGRIVAKIYGAATPIEAMQKHLFDSLQIKHIRRGRTLVKDQLPDETRYGSSSVGKIPDVKLDIPNSQSVMSNDRPIVARGYGNERYEDKEGSGGLSAATVDLARLVSVWISMKDTPVLKRNTVKDMLDKAVATGTKWKSRAGYGLDGAAHHGGENYYGQKGGDLITSQSVFEFNGEWGFAFAWGSHLRLPVANWYPDFPDVMNIAKSANWGSQDLFPNFGMPSL